MANEAKITKVRVLEHPNADKLELVEIGGAGGFISVIGKGQFTTGDLALYIEPDSVIPKHMQDYLKETSKIEIKGGRIRAVKIRGVVSEGLCFTPELFLKDKDIVEGNDVTEILGVKHYEPPTKGASFAKALKGVNYKYNNRRFQQYPHIDRFQKHPGAIKEGEEVVATIKVHGTNLRVGIVKKPDEVLNSYWHQFKRLLGFTTDYEYLVGSRTSVRNVVGKRRKKLKKRDFNKDLYCRAADKYNLKAFIDEIAMLWMEGEDIRERPDIIIYAEIIGCDRAKAIQKGYSYGCNENELKIVVFDIKINGRFISWDKVQALCAYSFLVDECLDIPVAEEVYYGPFNLSVLKLAEETDKIYANDGYILWKGHREGIVIKPNIPRKDPRVGWVMLKELNKNYLLDKKNTDYH